jgi:hypothetical protein
MNAATRADFAAVTLLPIMAIGQTESTEPIKTTPCEVGKSPAYFNAKIITLRAPIETAFEDFGLSVSERADKKLDYVWLEYGKGPKRQPTICCCGDMAPMNFTAAKLAQPESLSEIELSQST